MKFQKKKKSQYVKNRDIQFKINMLGENDLYKTVGSAYGIFVLIVGLTFSLIIFVQMINEMYTRSKDINLNSVIINDFTKYNQAKLNDLYFLPHIQIIETSSIDKNNTYKTFDYNKLRKYFQIQLTVRKRVVDGSFRVIKEMKYCSEQNFQKFEGLAKTDLNNRFCPDIAGLEEFFIVKNEYSNTQLRHSISIDIVKCHINQNTNCQSDDMIDDLLSKIYFTQYVVQESSSLGGDNLGKKATIFENQFHRQFQISQNAYQDNNNFLFHHLLQQKDNRHSFSSNFQEYEFYKLHSDLSWTGAKFIQTQNISYDGINYNSIERHVMYGSYIFFYSKRAIEQRVVFSYLNLLANFGGIFSGIFMIIIILCIDLNYNCMMSSFCEQMYFPNVKNCQSEQQQQIFRFNVYEKLSDIFWLKPFFCFVNQKDNAKLFKHLKQKTETQMNMYNIISRIQKLTAVVNELCLQDNHNILKDKAQQHYLDYLHACQQQRIQDEILYDQIDSFGQQESEDTQIDKLNQQTQQLCQKQIEITYIQDKETLNQSSQLSQEKIENNEIEQNSNLKLQQKIKEMVQQIDKLRNKVKKNSKLVKNIINPENINDL